MPRVHEREKLVKAAELKLGGMVADACGDLTTAESLRVLVNVLGDGVGRIAKYAIRQERHGDTDKPGGWA